MSGPPAMSRNGASGMAGSYTFAKLVGSNLAVNDATLQVNVNGTTISINNVSETSLIQLSLLAPNPTYNSGISVVDARVAISSYVNPFMVTGLVDLMEQANALAITQNQEQPNPPVVYQPFLNSIWGSQSITEVTDTLSGLAPYTPDTLYSVKTYSLTLRVISLN